MKQIEVDELVIEITRKCNMCCAHCLRGPAEDINISDDVIDRIFQDICYIGTITFTGGEPSLYPEAMDRILKQCKEHEIIVGSFYLVTNGKELSDRFLHSVLDWAIYTAPYDDDEVSGISLSTDKFHDSITMDADAVLRRFRFYRDTDHKAYGPIIYLIREGRASELDSPNIQFREPEVWVSTVDNDMIERSENSLHMIDIRLYISATGEVKLGCDDSYKNMTNRIGTLSETRSLYDILEFFVDETMDDDEVQKNTLYTKILSQLDDSNDDPYDGLYYEVSISDTDAAHIEYQPNGSHVIYQKITQETTHVLADYVITRPSKEVMAWQLTMLLNEQ